MHSKNNFFCFIIAILFLLLIQSTEMAIDVPFGWDTILSPKPKIASESKPKVRLSRSSRFFIVWCKTNKQISVLSLFVLLKLLENSDVWSLLSVVFRRGSSANTQKWPLMVVFMVSLQGSLFSNDLSWLPHYTPLLHIHYFVVSNWKKKWDSFFPIRLCD